MPVPTGSANAQLQRKVREAVVQRTEGRLRRLMVGNADSGLVVEAASPSYYAVQLLVSGIASVVSAGPPTAIRLLIDVNGRALAIDFAAGENVVEGSRAGSPPQHADGRRSHASSVARELLLQNAS